MAGTDFCRVCSLCGVESVPGERISLSRCTGCNSRTYCSTACQGLDWRRGHKELCESLGLAWVAARDLERETRMTQMLEASAFVFQPPFSLPATDVHRNVYILIKAMDHFKLDVRMQELACKALSMIGGVEPIEQRYIQAKRAGSAGVFPQILEAMCRFSLCEKLQSGAMMALETLVTHCRFNIGKFIKVRGVQCVLDAMCAHPTSMKLQGVGMVLLVTMNSEADTDISELELKRTVEVTAAVLLGHSTRSDERQDAVGGWGARRPRLRSLKTTHFLLLNVFSTENMAQLGEAGVVLAVVDIMHKNRGDPDTMVLGWDILSMLTDDNPANCNLMFSTAATLPYALCLVYMLLAN